MDLLTSRRLLGCINMITDFAATLRRTPLYYAGLGCYVALMTLLAMLLSGCTSEFEPDVDTSQKLCINALFTTGTPVTAEVTRTWTFSEGVPGKDFDINIPDADVSLYVDGIFCEKLEAFDDFMTDPSSGNQVRLTGYKGNHVPSPGETLRLVAHSGKYGDAEGEAKVPHAVPFGDVENNVAIEPSLYDCTAEYGGLHFELTSIADIQDPEGDDRYLFSFTTQDPAPVVIEPGGGTDLDGNPVDIQAFCTISLEAFNPDREPIFSEHMSSLDYYVGSSGDYFFFTDRSFINGHYKLRISFDRSFLFWNNPTLIEDIYHAKINITLSTISDDYYKWLLSVWQRNDSSVGQMGDIGLGNPVFEHSNVSTGAGIIAARTPSTHSIDMAPYIKKAIGMAADNDTASD